MANNSTLLLSCLHPEPIMPINDNNDIYIHSGQAETGEFYADANIFYEENYEEEMPFEESSNLNGVTEIPFVDESSEWELLLLLGDWYEPESIESLFSSMPSDAVFFSY